MIEKIIGRTDDLFWTKQKECEDLQCVFPDYIRRAIITSSEEIEDYQAIQKNFDKILVRINLKSENSDKDKIVNVIRRNIKYVFSSYKCIEPEINVVFEKPKRNINSNKLIRIMRDFTI